MAPQLPTAGKSLGLRRPIWLAAAAALVVVGSVGSVLGAQAVARSEAQRSHASFVTSSMEIASTLTLAIQH